MNHTLNLRTVEDGRLATHPADGSTSQASGAPAGAVSPAERPITNQRLWSGRVISGLAVAFLLFDGVTKVLQLPWVVKASTELGFPAGAILPVGVVLLACTAVYCIPRTAILGAILLTGYLGGAVAANVQAGAPLGSHTLFPLYFAVFVWGGLALRDRRIWAIFARPSARSSS